MADIEPGVSASERPLTAEIVRDRLDRVTDPELDESIVDLGYVDRIAIDERTAGAAVTVAFTLPTAWCSPAFAWMMAADARDATAAISGVDDVTVRLRDHMHDAEITEGVNGGRRFEAVFPDADGGLDAVREALDEKARLARQYDAVEALLESGVRPEQIVGLAARDCELLGDGPTVPVYLRDRSVAVCVPARPLRRYVEKAIEVDCLADPSDPLFRTPEGEPIPREQFELVHRRMRLASVNMRGQAGVCGALNDARRRALGRENGSESADERTER
ncbi:iron-sulfur cluster assembly protein [Haloferacaceae archaeon DSL9]